MYFKSNAFEIINQKRVVFTDSDYLGILYENEEILKETLTILSGKKLYLHPFTEFEFLRDVFAPSIRNLKEQFLSSDTFGHINDESHLEIFSRIFVNALLLSKIFAQQNIGKFAGNNKNISFVDLILASLLMYLKDKAVLITGNKKDFPSCVFDIVGVINFEQEDGYVRTITLVEFNQEKFDKCYECLKKLEV